MFDDSGFGCLGAEETTKDKALDVLKKVGPTLVSTVTEELTKGKTPTAVPIAPTPQKTSAPWYKNPLVYVIGAVVLGGAGFGIYKMVK